MLAPHVADLIALLGDSTLLLSWPKGFKGTKKRWRHLTLAAMQDAQHLKSLAHGNIGVALGPVSANLVSVDVDSDDGFAEFLRLNPVSLTPYSRKESAVETFGFE